MSDLPVVVIGAGPVGLAAASHLVERGMQPLVLEAGETVGASVLRWGHVRVFSPWRFNLDRAAARLLTGMRWTPPAPGDLPTGADLVDVYLRPLADHPSIRPHVRLGVEVIAVARNGVDKVRASGRDNRPFVIRFRDRDGAESEILARAVIDASGTYGSPNPLGANGLPAIGETAAAGWVSEAMPDVLGVDRDRFAGRRVLVIGSGHSAANTLLALAQLASDVPETQVHWAIRSGDPSRTYGGGDADELPARGRLGARLRDLVTSGRVTLHAGFRTSRLEPLAAKPEDGPLRVISLDSDGVERALEVDVIVSATGFRPDFGLARELRLDLDPTLESVRALAPLIDPNSHSCGTVRPHGHRELEQPDSGYYVVGMKSYGRAPTFLMATGYEQVRSVVAALAGDLASADTVELELPATGVCSTSLTPVSIGLATGIQGELSAFPLEDVSASNGGGCCG